MPNGNGTDWPTDIEGRVRTLRRDVNRVAECVEQIDNRLDKLTLASHENRWKLTALFAVVSIVGNAIVIPIVLKSLGG